MSEGFWMGLQVDYDAAQVKDALAETLAKITPWRASKGRVGGIERVGASRFLAR
jgi:plasmid maintenance system antidote protein VapI